MRKRVLDLTGVEFGKLKVEALAERPEGKRDRRSYWLCRCQCGRTEVIAGEDLNANRRKRCRWCTEEINNLEGREFGTWQVERKATQEETPDQPSAGKMSWWKVKCVLCGAEAIRSRPQLRNLKRQCECIAAPKARPFVMRTVEESKPTKPIPIKTRKCPVCKKIFELETMGQWGWNIGNELFCTYKCMRVREKERMGKPRRGGRA